MPRRFKSLFAIVLAVSAISLLTSCSQTDDIITPIYRSEIFLSPERLPNNPPGMIYTIWVLKEIEDINGNVIDTTYAYVGMFGYDQKKVQFLDENNEPRPDSNAFVFEGDLFGQTQLFVAIDTLNFSTLDPGPMMLVDDITDPSEDRVELRFPQSDSLWNSTVRYNMETMTDGDYTNARFSNDGFGIWFSNYRTQLVQLRDTFALTGFSVTATTKHTLPAGTTADTSIIDTINYSVDTTMVVVGQDLENGIYALDTFRVIKANFDYVFSIDTDSPWVHYEPVLTFQEDILRTFTVDLFSQDDFGLIDYSGMGWKYKGWIVSPNINPALVNTRITLPAWLLGIEAAFPGAEGGMLTTGTFGDITKGDDANPYSSTENPDRVPPFPGEDFLNGLPVGVLDTSSTDGLLDGTPNNIGTVFLSLEPENFNSDTTNFPLIVMVGPLPTATSQLAGANNIFTLTGKMQTNDQWTGFPSIKVSFKLF